MNSNDLIEKLYEEADAIQEVLNGKVYTPDSEDYAQCQKARDAVIDSIKKLKEEDRLDTELQLKKLEEANRSESEKRRDKVAIAKTVGGYIVVVGLTVFVVKYEKDGNLITSKVFSPIINTAAKLFPFA